MTRRITHEEFLEEVHLLVGSEYTVLEEYRGRKKSILLRHNTCGCEWKVSPGNFLKKTRCPDCALKIRSRKRALTHEEFISKVAKFKNNEYTVIGTYVNSRTPIEIMHNECGYTYQTTPSIILGGSKCPKCAGRVKINHDIFSKRVKKLVGEEYDIESTINSSADKVTLKHNVCGHVYSVVAGSFMRGARCPKCGGTKKLTQEEFVERVEILGGGSYKVLGEYVNDLTKVRLFHTECNRDFELSPGHFKAGQRCVKCNRKDRLTQEQYVERVMQCAGDEYEVVGKYIDTYTKIAIKHKVCGNTWKVKPHNFTFIGSRCPFCSRSKGEELVSKILKERGYSFREQYRIAECRQVLPLPFDFAIFDNDRLVCLIEYEGRQHFEPIEAWGGMRNFRNIQTRDGIKRDYCKSNNIPLLEIPYWTEDIEGLLDKELHNIIKYQLSAP